MAVMLPRENWTDKRLDEFEKRIDERFDRVDRRFKVMDQRFDRIEGDIRELRQAVNQVQRTMVIGFIGLAGLIVSAQVFF